MNRRVATEQTRKLKSAARDLLSAQEEIRMALKAGDEDITSYVNAAITRMDFAVQALGAVLNEAPSQPVELP